MVGLTERANGGLGGALAFAAAAAVMGLSYEPPGRETWGRKIDRHTGKPPKPPGPTAKRAKVKAARKANTKRKSR